MPKSAAEECLNVGAGREGMFFPGRRRVKAGVERSVTLCSLSEAVIRVRVFHAPYILFFPVLKPGVHRPKTACRRRGTSRSS